MKYRPHALVTNDDGIESAFLHRLVEALLPDFEVSVAAPAFEQSWIGRAISRHSEIEVIPGLAYFSKDVQAWAIGGTPTDCVNIALGNLLRKNRTSCYPASTSALTRPNPSSSAQEPSPEPSKEPFGVFLRWPAANAFRDISSKISDLPTDKPAENLAVLFSVRRPFPSTRSRATRLPRRSGQRSQRQLPCRNHAGQSR